MYTITVFGKEVFKSEKTLPWIEMGLELLSSSWSKDVEILRNGIKINK